MKSGAISGRLERTCYNGISSVLYDGKWKRLETYFERVASTNWLVEVVSLVTINIEDCRVVQCFLHGLESVDELWLELG